MVSVSPLSLCPDPQAAGGMNGLHLVPSKNRAPFENLGDASVQLLSGLDWLEQITEMHQAVRAEMPEAKRHCLMPKTAAYFHDLLTGKTGVLFGVVVDGKIVGCMSAVPISGFAEARIDGLITCPDSDGKLAVAYGHGPAAVAQSLCVLKAFGGRGFSHALIRAFIAWGRAANIPHLFAQVAEENAVSWMRFLSYGFAIIAGWQSGHARFLLRWVSPKEKDNQLGRAMTSDLHSVKKDYAELPALLVIIGAMLRKGRIVLADGAEPSSDRLNLVFGTR